MAREYIASPPLEKDVDEKVANLKMVKWARLDYITEWESCARWMITRWVFVSESESESQIQDPRPRFHPSTMRRSLDYRYRSLTIEHWTRTAIETWADGIDHPGSSLSVITVKK
jgi:hypothetical protein